MYLDRGISHTPIYLTIIGHNFYLNIITFFKLVESQLRFIALKFAINIPIVFIDYWIMVIIFSFLFDAHL